MNRTLAAGLVALATSLAPVAALADPAPPFVHYELEGNNLKVPGPVAFETGSDKLKPESDSVIDYVKGYLEAKPYISLMRIEVHTDNQGDAAKNQALSEKRAMAVARALVGKGVKCDRLIPVGFGDTKPVDSNSTPEGKAKNRRTVFANAALRGRPIGGMPVDGGGKPAGDVCK